MKESQNMFRTAANYTMSPKIPTSSGTQCKIVKLYMPIVHCIMNLTFLLSTF